MFIYCLSFCFCYVLVIIYCSVFRVQKYNFFQPVKLKKCVFHLKYLLKTLRVSPSYILNPIATSLTAEWSRRWSRLLGGAAFLPHIKNKLLKNKGKAEDLANYRVRQECRTSSYAMRKALALRNSSKPVEKANDICVAKRQTHNGMFWSPSGAPPSLSSLPSIATKNSPNG